jgi:hypothetical protein
VGSAGHLGAKPAWEQLRQKQQWRDAAADQITVAAPACIAANTALVVAAWLALAAVVSPPLQSRLLPVEK